MIEGVIYRYKSPSGKYYIGQTIDEERRRYNFLRDITYAGDKINYARKKYGPENFEYTVLMKVTGDDKEEIIRYLNILEPFFIKQYNSIENGYNSSEGGKNGLLSEYTKKKMSDSRRGKIPGNKGIPMTDEQRLKISIAKKGKPSARLGKHYGHRLYNPDGSYKIIRTVDPNPITPLW